MTRSLARIATFATLAFTLAACGSDSATSPTSVSVNGTYSLQTVNGAAVPFILQGSGANKVEIVSDVFTFSSAGTFTERAVLRFTENGVLRNENYDDSGTYTKSGTAITLRYTDASTGSGTIDGNTMTL
ncbi:MAG TPA: hypothetical protein VGD77_12075, partial [Gemmatimonadaceae bacterium]